MGYQYIRARLPKILGSIDLYEGDELIVEFDSGHVFWIYDILNKIPIRFASNFFFRLSIIIIIIIIVNDYFHHRHYN